MRGRRRGGGRFCWAMVWAAARCHNAQWPYRYFSTLHLTCQTRLPSTTLILDTILMQTPASCIGDVHSHVRNARTAATCSNIDLVTPAPAIYRKKIDLEQFRAVPDVPSSSEIIGRCERFDTMPANNDRPPAPPSFYCPLTMNLMKNPVQDREGNTYERFAIEQWLQSNHTSPITRNRQVSIATVSYVARRKCLTFVQAKKKAPSSQ